MTKTVIMPQLGMTMQEGTINKWFFCEGDRVQKGKPLLEVTIDKGVVEIESPGTGVLVRIMKKEGDVVPVTEALASIEE
jgi:pyruvate/2-oxoglutarate dehydrogenase complex dihydrolipoamide acyltransferase (E2) component